MSIYRSRRLKSEAEDRCTARHVFVHLTQEGTLSKLRSLMQTRLLFTVGLCIFRYFLILHISVSFLVNGPIRLA